MGLNCCTKPSLVILDKHMVRLVIIGCKHKYGEDYVETFSLVAKMATARTVMAVAAIQEWYTYQMDVTNAFCMVIFTKKVYIKLPQGYHGIGSKIKLNSEPESSLPQNVVCQFKKSLYGLKQAPRQWFSKLSKTLMKFGYIQSKADYSLC